jgi:hypothetical protein
MFVVLFSLLSFSDRTARQKSREQNWWCSWAPLSVAHTHIFSLTFFLFSTRHFFNLQTFFATHAIIDSITSDTVAILIQTR